MSLSRVGIRKTATGAHTITNYQLGQADSFNPNYLSEQQNQYTFRPRTFGLNASMHL